MEQPPLLHRMNLTPIIGVLLALLVVLLATTKPIGSTLELAIPPAIVPPGPMRIYEKPHVRIGSDGTLTVNGRPVERTEMTGSVHQILLAAGGDVPKTVYISSEAGGRYGSFASIARELRDAGYSVAIVTEQFEN